MPATEIETRALNATGLPNIDQRHPRSQAEAQVMRRAGGQDPNGSAPDQDGWDGSHYSSSCPQERTDMAANTVHKEDNEQNSPHEQRSMPSFVWCLASRQTNSERRFDFLARASHTIDTGQPTSTRCSPSLPQLLPWSMLRAMHK
ncbi:hypothetical protein AC579_7265 [Pseudocercospora musae]|uniref:Uncharacterized protein n=1 Tax=Pseudocercospora musae TaxID=113226 RepID=A0A139I3A9_9PEZI|nr:hypothetical protein AC579_7265 [Pseudocercospora musae]